MKTTPLAQADVLAGGDQGAGGVPGAEYLVLPPQSKVKTFLRDFSRLYGAKYSVAASSGTAALHVALGAAGISVGDEVITSPITDLGTVIGILYQNAIPVFADVDPHTYNLNPASVEERITERTKAIVVVHLAAILPTWIPAGFG